MNKDDIMDSIGRIDDDLIQEVDNLRQRKRKPVRMKWGILVACFCFVVMCVIMWKQIVPLVLHTQDDVDGVTIPSLEVDLSTSSTADMIGLFIYQGRCYVQKEWFDEDVDFVGAHLGTVTGRIDEWTPEDGYVDFAGTASGEIYEVKGYDTSFMLCMKHVTGAVETYVCNTGITLQYGSELFEDRLHLSENYQTMSYQTYESYKSGTREFYELEAGNFSVIDAFIKELDVAKILLWDMVLEKEEKEPNEMNKDMLYRLYFHMKNGMTVDLMLYENGYVRYGGMWDVCVQIPQKSFDNLINLLDKREGTMLVKEWDSENLQDELEECRSIPELGMYIPTYEPEGTKLNAAYAIYEIDVETAKEIRAESIMVGYYGQQGYDMIITTKQDAEKYIYEEVALIDSTELSVDRIAQMKDTSKSNIEMCVAYGEVIVYFISFSLEEEEAYKVLSSVNAVP